MTFHAGMDRRLFKAHLAQVERSARRSEFIKGLERAAELSPDDHQDDQSPEVITADQRGLERRKDGSTISGAGQYTLDPFNKARDRKLGNARRAKPKQYVVHETDSVLTDGRVIPAGTLEKEFDEVHLKLIAQGQFCITCEDRQPETAHEHRERLQRLRDHTGYEVPSGLSPFDVCCYCGARLQAKAPGGR